MILFLFNEVPYFQTCIYCRKIPGLAAKCVSIVVCNALVVCTATDAHDVCVYKIINEIRPLDRI